jgi:PKD repeat protein
MQFKFKPGRLLVLLSLILTHLAVITTAQTSFTASSYSGCKPLTVQFTNTSSNAVSYSWDFGNGTYSTQQHPVNVYTIPGTYTVTLTTNGGSSYSAVIHVNNGPVADFSTVSATACQSNEAIQFINTSSAFDSCVWDFGDGSTSSSVSPSHIYNLPGAFTVTLVVYDTINNCSSNISRNQYVSITPLPVVAIAANDSASCDKAFPFHFTGTGANVSSWLWDFGDGQTSALQNPVHIYNDTGYFDITLIVSGASGCTDTVFYPHFIHVLYNEVPPINAYKLQGCLPLWDVFSTSNLGIASWKWNLGDGSKDSVFTAFHSYVAAGSYMVNLQVQYSNGCGNSNSAGPVIVDSLPAFTFSLQNTSGCAPLNVQCINNDPGLPYTWKWYFGDGDSSSAVSTSHIYTMDGTYGVKLVAVNAAGCTWGYEVKPKVILSSPQAIFTPDRTSGCSPLTVNFNNYSVNGMLYEWDFGDGSFSTASNPSHTYTVPGIYIARLRVTNASGCVDSLISNITVTLSGNSFIPLVPITACAPFTINFTDNSLSSAWLWNFGDSTTSVLSNPSHTFTVPGIYNVSLSTTGSNGNCSQHIPDLRTIIINGGVADFTHTESLCPPYTGTFTDSSQNATGWLWDFGDGGTSAAQNPVHVFGAPGYHSVGLTITTAQGCKVSTVKNLEVYFEPLTAATSTYTTDTVLPIAVQFYSNTTGATYWHWDFGDGDTSVLQDPLHIYTTAGPYTITLIIGNDSCNRSYTYQPQDFGTGTVNQSGGAGNPVTPPVIYHCAPYEVDFNNPYPGALFWHWDFGDGTSSNDSDPSHKYTTSGDFQVTLVVTLSGGLTDTLLLPEHNYIDAFDGDFTVTTAGGCNGITATLTPSDTTATCSWELGDGSYSSVAVPVHIYPLANLSYLISLNATDSNGCSAASAQTFYSDNINPVNVSATRACAGDTVFFSNTGTKYTSYLWKFGDGDSSSLENPFHIYTDSGIYIVTLAVFDSTGCSNSYTMNGSVQIFKPQAFFTIADVQSNCSFVFAELQNLSSGYDYLFWDFGNGVTASQPSQYATYYTPGYYYITLTVTQSVCSSTYTSPVPVFVPLVKADFDYIQTAFCSPVNQQFTDLSTDAALWFWSFGDGATDTAQNPLHAYSSQPSADVTLYVKDIYGCASTITKSGITVSQASFKASGTAGCIPLTVLFTDTSSNAASYHWNFGDGDTSTDPSPVHIYNSQGVFNVELVIASASGCTDTLLMNNYIHAGDITADFIADSLTGCAPLLVQFTDQSVNAVSWSWDFGDGSYSGLRNPAHIYNVPGAYAITLIAFDSLGCADTMQMTSPVKINGSVPFFTVSSSAGCLPYTVSFTNLSTGAVSYEWNFGNGVTDTSFQPSYIYTLSGNYSVSLTTLDSSGCENIYTGSSPLIAGQSPVADFTYADSTGCTPFLPAIINKSLYADSLVWDFGDGTLSNDINPSHSYTNAGTYYISLYVYNSSGCSDSIVHAGPFVVGATPAVSFMSTDSSGCTPSGIQFMSTSTNLDQPVYYWDFGNGDTSSLQDPFDMFTTPGNYTISLMVTNAGGCYDKHTAANMIVIYDQAAPPATKLFSVSVNDTSGIDISWEQMNLSSIEYYTVYRANSMNTYDSIGSYIYTSAPVKPAFRDASVNTAIQPYSYKVLAVDHCGNRIDLADAAEHTSIFVSGVNNGSAVSLSWTPYGGCSVSGYRIYRSDALPDNFQLVGTVDSSTTYFNDLETYCPLIYRYRIEGINICGEATVTAFSNAVAVDHTDYQWQQNVELTRATVVNNSYVLVEWNQPALLPFTVIGYDIYRSTDHINFDLLSRVNASQLYYEDYATDVNHANYYYKVTPVNYCDLIGALSNEGSSVLLQGNVDDAGKIRLRWTSYSEWKSGVDHYILERMNEYGVWEPLKTLSGSANDAED